VSTSPTNGDLEAAGQKLALPTATSRRAVRAPVRAAFVRWLIWGRAVASPIPSASARLAALCRPRKGGHWTGSRSLVRRPVGACSH